MAHIFYTFILIEHYNVRDNFSFFKEALMSANDNQKEINSIVAAMFYGEVHEEEVFPYPHFTENQVEMAKAMVDAVDKFAATSIDSAKLDKDAKIPAEVLQGLAGLGLCGLGVGEEYGGLGLDTTL